MRAISVFLFVACVLTGGVATGQGVSESCAQIDDDARRLDCYDRRAGRTPANQEPRPSDVTDGAADDTDTSAPAGSDAGPAESPPDARAVEEFGLDTRDPADAGLEQIHARITEIRDLRSNHRLFTLDNGQVWLEGSATPHLRLEPGDRVRIESAAFGSYRLFGSGKTSTRVTRQQ